jgi:hypothetical protein
MVEQVRRAKRVRSRVIRAPGRERPRQESSYLTRFEGTEKDFCDRCHTLLTLGTLIYGARWQRGR